MARGPLQDHPGTPPEALRDPFRDRFWNRSENILSIFGLTQLAPKLAQNCSPHRLDTAIAPFFFPHRPELSKFGERPVTSPQASSIRPLPRQGEERRAEIYMSICQIWDKKSSHGPKSVADLSGFSPFSAPKMGPNRTKTPQDAPRWPNMSSKMVHDGHRDGHKTPRSASYGTRSLQDGPIHAQDASRMSLGRQKTLKKLWFSYDPPTPRGVW